DDIADREHAPVRGHQPPPDPDPAGPEPHAGRLEPEIGRIRRAPDGDEQMRPVDGPAPARARRMNRHLPGLALDPVDARALVNLNPLGAERFEQYGGKLRIAVGERLAA